MNIQIHMLCRLGLHESAKTLTPARNHQGHKVKGHRAKVKVLEFSYSPFFLDMAAAVEFHLESHDYIRTQSTVWNILCVEAYMPLTQQL